MTNAEKLQDIANKTGRIVTVNRNGDSYIWNLVDLSLLDYCDKNWKPLHGNGPRVSVDGKYVDCAGRAFTPQPLGDDMVMVWDESMICCGGGVRIMQYKYIEHNDYWAPIDKDLIDKAIKDWPEDKQKGVEG